MKERPAVIFLVDDDASVRRALTRLIRSAGHRVESFATAREFLAGGWDSNGPSCLVLDVQMPGLSGLDLQRELQELDMHLPIIFITGQGDIPMGVRAMKAGAVDFLPKPVRAETLLPAIEQALAQASRERIAVTELDDIRRRVDSLTTREREVMELVVTGMINKQIAYKLGIVEQTIKVHRGRMMEKMAVGSLAELVRLAEKVGIPAKPAN